jgi:hypothetical protein
MKVVRLFPLAFIANVDGFVLFAPVLILAVVGLIQLGRKS